MKGSVVQSCLQSDRCCASPIVDRVHTRCRRTKVISTTTPISSLPEELLIHLFHHLHIKDLLNLASTHHDFADLISSTFSVWCNASFMDVWPTAHNLRHFERAADHGNIEALVKLGIAYLYNAGLPGDFQGERITVNGEHAATMLCRVEAQTARMMPFTWLFIRPPWSILGTCCKECVFNNMLSYVKKNNDVKVLICIARTLDLLEGDVYHNEAMYYLQQAVNSGSSYAAYLLWQHKYQGKKLEPGTDIESIRELRDIVMVTDGDSHEEAMLELCRMYGRGRYGGLSQGQADTVVRSFIQSSVPSHVNAIYVNKLLTHSMRFILVDWLVEVAGMKDFTSQTLHAAVHMVDQYLKLHPISRSQLQLLGVAAMVLCSRFLGHDIITIREAAWLTDNTYIYEDVVRMMGEITATLKGRLRVLTVLDYLELFELMAQIDYQTQCLAEYMGELCLLQSDLAEYSQAQIGASCLLLALIQQSHDSGGVSSLFWTDRMQSFTGFTLQSIAVSTMHLYDKCFRDSTMVDHREVILQAVKTRYSDIKYNNVGSSKMLSRVELEAILGVENLVFAGNQVDVTSSTQPNNATQLIMSPSRNKDKHPSVVIVSDVLDDRENAATPFIDRSLVGAMVGSHPDVVDLNTSTTSGYDGDHDDDDSPGEFHTSNNDASFDLESLWCSDGSTVQRKLPAPQSARYSSPLSLSCLPSLRVSVLSAPSSQVKVLPGTSPVINSDSAILTRIDQHQTDTPGCGFLGIHSSGDPVTPLIQPSVLVSAACSKDLRDSRASTVGCHGCASYPPPPLQPTSTISSPIDIGIEMKQLDTSISSLSSTSAQQISRRQQTVMRLSSQSQPSTSAITLPTSQSRRHRGGSTIQSSISDRSPSTRPALHTLNGNRRTSSPNVSIKRLKRKNVTDLGNENKTFVVSL